MGELTLTKNLNKALDLLQHQRGCCFFCGYRITDPRELALNHLTPKSRNGSGAYYNLVASCKACGTAFDDVPVKAKIIYLLYMRGAATKGDLHALHEASPTLIRENDRVQVLTDT